jgi:RNA polymerase sigma factor (sigma-70 family)
VPLRQKTPEDFISNTEPLGEENQSANRRSEACLREIVGGDSAAFWQLWSDHEKYLYRICLRQLGGVHEEAEDALSLLMVKLLDLLPQYADRIQNLKAWLSRITYNLCIDIRRERKRAWNLESIDDLTGIDSPALLSSTESPEETTLRREARRLIDSAIADLALRLRVPFLLHHLYDLPYSEIAEQLAISPENARKRGQLARGILQDRLKEYVTASRIPGQPRAEADSEVCLPPFRVDDTAEKKIPAQRVALRLVNVVLNSGIERSFCIHLDYKPLKLTPKIERSSRYADSNRGGWKKRLKLAHLFYEAGQWRGAVREYQHVLEKQPGLIHVYLELGRVLDLMEGEPDSIATYQKALTITAEPAIKRHINGLIETRRRNYEKAVSEFKKATTIEPDQAVHWYQLAMVNLLKDSPLEALQCFEETLRLVPNHLMALTHLPELLRDLGRTGEADRYLNRALATHDGNALSIKTLVDFRSRRRLVFGAEGRITRGLLRRAVAQATKSPEIQATVAAYHLCRGEWVRGIEILKTFTERHPACPEGWCHLANAHLRTGDVEAATVAVRRALRLDANAWTTNLIACQIFRYQVPAPELRRFLGGILERFSERWRAWAIVGEAWLSGLKEPSRACAISAEAPKLQPRLSNAWFRHSAVLMAAGKYDLSISSGKTGWRFLPEDDDGLNSGPAAMGLAQCYLLTGNSRMAEIWMNEAASRLTIAAEFSPAEERCWRGRLGEFAQDRVGAKQAYETALGLNLLYPMRYEAEEGIARLSSRVSRRARLFPVI